MNSFAPLRPIAVPMMDDPDFGPLRASQEGRGATWNWESLDLLNTPRGWADLAFLAGPEGPGDAHRRQLHSVLAQLDSLTRAAAPMIFGQLSQCIEGPPSDNLSADLDWQGAQLTGRPGEFSLHFACRNWPEALVVVRFRGWKPVAVEIDD